MKQADYYSRTADRVFDWKDNLADARFAPFQAEILPLVEQLPIGGRVLDIGCQAGHMLNLIRSQFDEAYGLDIGDYSEYWGQWPEIKFLRHDVDAQPLPFETDSMSLVLCNNVFEHVFDVFGLCKEIGRVLKPGGYCIIMVPNAGYLRHILTLLRGLVPRTGSQTFPFNEKDGWDGSHLHYFTLRELTGLLKQNRVQTMSVKSSGRFQWARKICPRLLYADLVILGQCQK